MRGAEPEASESARPQKLVFVNRFYGPDLSATSQILTDVAEAMAARGYAVKIVTSRMSYDGAETYPAREVQRGVSVHRIRTTRFGRAKTIGRAIDYLTFYLSVSLSLMLRLSKNDLLIAKTDPPMLSIPLGVIARLKGVKLVHWLQDVFPEVATELGVGSRQNPFVKLLKALRDRSLKRAAMTVVIGERMAEMVASTGTRREQITVIDNFVDDEAITPRPDHAPALRQVWGFHKEDFIVGYSGNLGRAHDLETMLDAAAQLADRPDIKFLFIGGGFLHAQLTQAVAQRGLSNIVLQPYQPRARLQESLAVPNLHWVSLRPSLEGYILPSKVYGIAAAGRPLLMVGAQDGEVGRFLNRYGFGSCVAPGAVDEAVGFITRLAGAREEAETLGKNARRLIDERASKAQVFERWDQLFQRITGAAKA